MKFAGWLALVTLLVPPSPQVSGGLGAAGSIHVSEDRLVHADPDGLPLVEPHLSIDPEDPRRMLAGAMLARRDGTYGVAGFTSQDGGRSWSRHEFAVTDGGDAWTAVLPGGEFVLALLSGERSELQVFVSPDGRTWPQKGLTDGAAHDHPTLVVDRGKARAERALYLDTRTPAIAVNTEGVVGVAWYDGRDDRAVIKGSLRCREIYFAASLEGGRTFLPEVKVSSGKTCPSDPRNIATAPRFPAGGEYMGLAAAPDGTFHVLWADSRDGVYQLRTATASARAAGQSRSGPHGEDTREAWQKVGEIFEAMQVKPGAVVADIGAGDGFFTSRLARAVGSEGRVHAVDVAADALQRLRRRVDDEGLTNVSVVEGTVEDPKLPVASVDAILIVNAYHEMTAHQTMLAKMKAALRPGGRLVIVEPIGSSRRERPREDQTRSHEIAAEFVRADARAAGFREVALHDPFTTRPQDKADEWMLVLTPDPPQIDRAAQAPGKGAFK